MKRYKLLKDTPTIKAGTIFEKVVRGVDGIKGSAVVVPIGANTDFQWTIKDIDNFDEWFEEIEELTDSIRWKPKKDDEYFWMNSYGETQPDVWDGDSIDSMRLALGMVYRTEEECEEARERRLAEVRLRQTSDFKPDFEDSRGGWVVYYNYKDKELYSYDTDYDDSGETIRYATEEDSRKSIKENREDWLKYFGVEE